MLVNQATSIGRLRVRSDVRDTLLTRIRLERMLSGVDWRPTTLPANAILCIRKAYDPLPHSFSLSASSLQPGHEWQQALTSMLNRFASQAVRPLTNFVPPHSKAVVFLDHAELLACLALEWCRGSLTTNWWWRGILGNRDLAAVVKLWNDKPEYVPAALHHLAIIKFVVPFVARLSDATSSELARSIAHSFGATTLWPLLEVAVPRKAFADGVSATTDHDRVARASATFDAAEYPPWRALVPEIDDGLSPEQQRFLGIGLTIYRASSLARSHDFARALERWQSSINGESRSFSTRSLTKTPPPPKVTTPAQPRNGHVSANLETREPEHEHVGEQSTTEPIAKQLLPVHAEPSPSPHTITSSQPEHVSLRSEDDTRLAIPESSPVAASFAQSEAAATVDLEPFETPVIDFETRLGGLFYLINLGIYLNLYADFTSPLKPGIDLNIWDFVTLVGRKIVQDTHDEDPIWAALTKLAGRNETQHFEPDKKTRRWLSHLMPKVRARLRAALALKSNNDIAKILCRHYARVCATDTHVDVYFNLADLPLAVRFAGLDRDPGWVPAAGRFILFHFD